MILHFVSENFPPTKGGLEMWTYNHAKKLSVSGFRVYIHITGENAALNSNDFTEDSSFEIINIFSKRLLLEEPLVKSNYSTVRLSLERSRLNFLILRNSIRQIISKFPNEKHVVISNFITGTGYLSSLVSDNLSIPHIACVVGTDYSRGFYNSKEREMISTVVKQASSIVTWNNEQANAFKKAFRTSNIITIHTSIGKEISNYQWSKKKDTTIKLFSDCGYSHKKGTQLLIKAFDILVSEGCPLKLTLCGETLSVENSYWEGLIALYKEKHRDRINFLQYLSTPLLLDTMLAHDIYCSATLGEGCSQARVAALCIGIPIVTTMCGEMSDISLSQHIRMSQPGDEIEFVEILRRACDDLLEDKLLVDENFVKKWNHYFTSNREVELWTKLLEEIV